MLTDIYIRDLATIQEVHLSLQKGCNMMTGETGAGKSIFIEAIELALGGRASPTLIRADKEKAEISLSFDITHFPHVIACLQQSDLYDQASECIIRRIITTDGRSRCYVNGSPAPLALVKELGELLFHVHSQHAQQVLLKSETQREMLDRFADHLPLVVQVQQAAEQVRLIQEEIARLRTQTQERAERCDYLRFQLTELQGIQLAPGEWEALEVEHRRLTHAEELMHHLQHALQQLHHEDEPAILSQLKEVRKLLENVTTVEPKAHEWISTLDSAFISLQDLTSELDHYLGGTENDPKKLAQLEERISHIFTLARKHKISPPELIALKDRLTTELSTLENSDEKLAEHEKQLLMLEKQYQNLATQLTNSRQRAADQLAKEVTSTIRALSLPHADFRIALEKETHAFSPHGQEKIVFIIKTNPDQHLQPLAKVISGGELSRLSLAVHLALATQTTIPTLVFDEVDTGLSGATAEKIGKLLRKLGESYQVFCVTHQPQVAACGDHHILVEKKFVKNTTHTSLRLLTVEERTKEIARMLGGEKITSTTYAHAEELLQDL